jgi:prepilin peptidase CpaA
MKDLVITLLPPLLAALLLVAAWGDIRSRTIPNALNGAIALLAVPWWWATDISLWPGIPIQLAIAATVLLLFGALFAFGAMGGGDVKMLTALAFWLPPIPLLNMLTIMALAGGALTLCMLITHKLRKAQDKLEIPYGVAIAFAGLAVFGERYLNHFG